MTEDEAMLIPCPFCNNAVMFRKAVWPSDGNVDAIIHAGPSECGLEYFSDGSIDESIIAKWNTRAAIAAATAWQPISTALKDRYIQAWHVSWECPVAVRYLRDNNSECCWIEKTLTTRWPTRAFSHWTTLPEPPK